jgi:CBS domain-containing protein
MAKKVASRLEALQEKLGLLKKKTDEQRKAKKRAKKTEKRKSKKKKHQKQRAANQKSRKQKRQRMREHKEKKQNVKQRKSEKHKKMKVMVREKKAALKLKRVSRKESMREKIKLPEDVKIKEILEENLEEKTKEKEIEKVIAEEAMPEEPEQEKAEWEKSEQKELAKPEKKSKLSMPFKIKINLPRRKNKKAEKGKLEKRKTLGNKAVVGKKELDEDMSKDIIKQVIVADVMSTDPITVHANDKLSYLVRLFSSRNISGAPVVSDHSIIGIITKSDIIKVIGVKDLLDIDTVGLEKLGNSKVSDVMRKKVHFVNRYTKISDAADMMNKNDINLLPVVDDKKRIIGIVSRGDIVRVVSKELLTKMVQERRHIGKKMTKIETDIDSVLELIEKEGSINMIEVSKKLNVSEEKVEEWAKILEKEGIIEIFYPAFGSPKLRKKLKKEDEMYEEEDS